MIDLPMILTTNAAMMTSFTKIDIDASLFIPADACDISGPSTQEGVPISWQTAKLASQLSITLGGEPVFTGQQTRLDKVIEGATNELQFKAHSPAKTLVDCEPQQKIARPGGSLGALATELCTPFGIIAVVDAAASVPRKSWTTVSETEKIWSIFERLAKENVCTVWDDPYGAVHIESLKPYYLKPPVDTIVIAPVGAGQANRVNSIRLVDDAGERFSPVTVHGNKAVRTIGPPTAAGAFSVIYQPTKAMIPDPELVARGIVRPKTIREMDVRSIDQAMRFAAREVALRKIKGTKIILDIEGFTTMLGVPWQLTQMVTLSYPEEGIAGLYMVAGRRFTHSFDEYETELTLIESGVL